MRNRCSIKDCINYCKGQGYCSKHYAKFRKYGDPLKEVHNFKHDDKCSKCNSKYYGKGLCRKHYDQLPIHFKRRSIYSQTHTPDPIKQLASEKRYLEKIGSNFNMDSQEYKYALNSWSKSIKKLDNYMCKNCNSTKKNYTNYF